MLIAKASRHQKQQYSHPHQLLKALPQYLRVHRIPRYEEEPAIYPVPVIKAQNYSGFHSQL